MDNDVKKLLQELKYQNSTLNSLIEENQRLTSTYLSETSLEQLNRLIKESEDIKSKFEETIKEVNKGLTNKIELSSKGFEKLKGDVEEAKKNLESLNKQYEELGKTIDELEKKDPIGNKDEIEKLKKEQDEIYYNYCEQSDKLDELTNAYEKLKKVAIPYYTAANKAQRELNKRQEEGITFLDDYAEKWGKKTKAIRNGIKGITSGIKDISSNLMDLIDPWSKAEHAAMGYAKSIGMSRNTANELLEKSSEFATKNNIGLLFNKTTEELIAMQSKYSDVLGRNVQLTDEQKKDMMAMGNILGDDTMMSIANNLENFGLGMSDSADFVKKTMDDATKSGIAASKLTKTINDNIKMAQNYTFKNGLDGLSSMAKKALQLKTDLSLVNGFLEKTSTVEGAISTGAQLQVLGGNYAMGSDPLSMMYDSLNDMEGLFDRAVGMAKGKVYYDEKSGNFEMGAMDRYMMKQAANVMGVDSSKLIDVAFRQASLDKIEGQAKQNKVLNNDPQMMEMVKNLATWDNGEAVVQINGKAKKVSELTEDDKTKLSAMQNTDAENLQDMAIDLRSIKDTISGANKEEQNKRAEWMSWLGELMQKIMQNTNLIAPIAAGIAGFKIFRSIYNIFGGTARVVRGIATTTVGIRNLLARGALTGGGGGVGGGGGLDIGGRSGRIGNGFGRNKGIIGKTKQIGRIFSKRGFIGGGKKILGGIASKGILYGASGAAIGGVGGAAVSLVGDIISGDFKKNKRASIEKAVGTGVGAAIGGVFGPLGAMVGGWVGGAIGGYFQKRRDKIAKQVRKNFSKEFNAKNPLLSGVFEGENALQGSYSKKELTQIKNAIQDGKLSEGELSKSLLKRIKANDDFQRLKANNVKIGVEMASGGELVGPSHAEGGMPIVGSNIEVEGGEFVVNKESTKKYRGLLNKINNDAISNVNIEPKEPLGKQMVVINNYYNTQQSNKNDNNGKLSIEPINLNLNGTIKLDSGNKQIDISQEVLKNPTFITKLTELISKELNKLNNGAFDKEKYIQKFA